MNRWIAKHFWLVFFLGLLWVWILGLYAEVHEWGIVGYCICLFGSFGVGVWCLTRSNVLLEEPLNILDNQCDPGPALEETERQLQYPGPKGLRILCQMNHAVLLMETGRHEEAYTILTGIPEKRIRKFRTGAVKYYCNLLVICMDTGRYDEAEVVFEKMMGCFRKVKNRKLREQLRPFISRRQAEFYLLRQEYDKALAHCTNEAKSLSGRVYEANLLARVYDAMGETEKAKEKYEFVARNGNRLHIAAKAREMLEKVNMEEE